MKWWVKWALGFAVLGFVSGCSDKRTYRWQEEVLLHDGQVIVIDRSVRTGEVPVEIGQQPGLSDYTLRFKAIDGTPVTWDAGRDRFVPIILDFVEGVPYVVALGRTAVVYSAERCPRPPYFFFRWSAGEWMRVSYEDFPKALRNTNLTVGLLYRPPFNERIRSRELVTREDVRKLLRTADPGAKMVREDAPNPCATWQDEYRYMPKQ